MPVFINDIGSMDSRSGISRGTLSEEAELVAVGTVTVDVGMAAPGAPVSSDSSMMSDKSPMCDIKSRGWNCTNSLPEKQDVSVKHQATLVNICAKLF